MSIQSAENFAFGFWRGRPVQIERIDEQLSSDGGLLAFHQLDQKLGWTESFAALIAPPQADRTHSNLSMLRQRVFGIVAGYEDQNDHDSLRSDPIFKLIAGQESSDADLASQPTISRFENAVTAHELLLMEDWFIDRFVESFTDDPHQITLDIDTFDDPTHGQQQLALFHGFYDQYQYLARVITCAENDTVVLPNLLYGSAPASLGAAADLVRVIQKLKARFPDILVHVRADSGFAVPEMYEELEGLSGVTYSIGYGMHKALQKTSEKLMESVLSSYEQTKQPSRDFMLLEQKAQTWNVSRKVVIKCEANAQGTNRRAIVTNRKGVDISPAGTYDEYADRGESENRNKELKCELSADRLSDHRYMANLFRLMMHVMSANLLVTLRRIVADPPSVAPVPDDLPLEARSPHMKRQYHNRRRQADPLGEGHACTWRTHVIKVAVRVVVSTRRVRLLISQSWPFTRWLEKLGQALAKFSLPHPSS
jgi:Transposase DDE domain group 1